MLLQLSHYPPFFLSPLHTLSHPHSRSCFQACFSNVGLRPPRNDSLYDVRLGFIKLIYFSIMEVQLCHCIHLDGLSFPQRVSTLSVKHQVFICGKNCPNALWFTPSCQAAPRFPQNLLSLVGCVVPCRCTSERSWLFFIPLSSHYF